MSERSKTVKKYVLKTIRQPQLEINNATDKNTNARPVSWSLQIYKFALGKKSRSMLNFNKIPELGRKLMEGNTIFSWKQFFF